MLTFTKWILHSKRAAITIECRENPDETPLRGTSETLIKIKDGSRFESIHSQNAFTQDEEKIASK
jgi:hypothetical protein